MAVNVPTLLAVICICACISTISSTVASIGNDDSNMSEKDYCGTLEHMIIYHEK